MSANAALLRPGDLVPHFSVVDATGRRVSYRDTAWQRRELVLITLPPGADVAAESPALRLAEWGRQAPEDVAVIVTGDAVPGMPPCGFAVADRWGEIAVVQPADSPGALPSAEQLAEWVSFVQRQCPECQGETR
jgi:hypothetical protein